MIAPPIRTEFARRLKAFRTPRFPTARSFAHALGIDENRYTRYERAEVEPDLTLIPKICEVLGISHSQLMDGQGPSVAAAPGFGESAAALLTPPPRLDGNAVPQGSLRQALAWQLAEELAKVAGDGSASGYDRWSRTVETFREIDADPFGFMTQLQGNARLAALDKHLAGRIAEIAALFMKHLSTDILTNPQAPQAPGT